MTSTPSAIRLSTTICAPVSFFIYRFLAAFPAISAFKGTLRADIGTTCARKRECSQRFNSLLVMLRGTEGTAARFGTHHFQCLIVPGEHAAHRQGLARLNFLERVLAETGHVEVGLVLADQLPDVRPMDFARGIVNVGVLQHELVGFPAYAHRDHLLVTVDIPRRGLADDQRGGKRNHHRAHLRIGPGGNKYERRNRDREPTDSGNSLFHGSDLCRPLLNHRERVDERSSKTLSIEAFSIEPDSCKIPPDTPGSAPRIMG